MFITAVNVASEQKNGLKRELSQQWEWLFKEKENAEFLLFREKGSKGRDGKLKHCPHKLFFFSFVTLIQKLLFSRAGDNLQRKMSEVPFLHT